jgi:hypothetical protein
MRLVYNRDFTRSAPHDEPENWAARRKPEWLSFRFHKMLSPGRMQPRSVVPIPVKINPK